MLPIGSPKGRRPSSRETSPSVFVDSEASDADETDLQTGASFDEALMAEMHKTGEILSEGHALPQLH